MDIKSMPSLEIHLGWNYIWSRYVLYCVLASLNCNFFHIYTHCALMQLVRYTWHFCKLLSTKTWNWANIVSEWHFCFSLLWILYFEVCNFLSLKVFMHCVNVSEDLRKLLSKKISTFKKFRSTFSLTTSELFTLQPIAHTYLLKLN